MENDLPIIMEKEWSIPPSLIKVSALKRLVSMLKSTNQINETNSYYVRDFHTRKIIVDSDISTILCGYSKNLLDKEGFDFYKRILSEKELAWIADVYAGSYRVFYSYPPSKRSFLISNYEVEVITESQERLIVQHKSTPYLLCDNGNLWLSLCCVSISSQKQSGTATITNTETGELYEFKGDKFVQSEKLAITQEETIFLRWLCDGLSTERILALWNISDRSLSRKRVQLFEKLDAKTVGQAVHKAHLLGII